MNDVKFEKGDIVVEKISEYNIKVSGKANKDYISHWKALKGTFSYNLKGSPGWRISIDKKPQVEQLIRDIENGLIKPDEKKIYAKRDNPLTLSHKLESSPGSAPGFQTLTYTIIKPEVGDHINYRGVKGTVVDIMTDSDGNIDSFTFTHDDQILNAFIISGSWGTLESSRNLVTIER